MKKNKNVFQFKITLKGTKPPIWRRIQVPETYTFYDLHVAIQDAMGWTDTHLHEFIIQKPNTVRTVHIGVPDDFNNDTLQGWSNKITKFFTAANDKASYIYDFGDYWEHIIEFEGVLQKDELSSYPKCLSGKRACPPEDCGGIWGYQEICEGKHEYQEYYQDFDPKSFDPKEVSFSDPKEQFNLNFELVNNNDD